MQEDFNTLMIECLQKNEPLKSFYLKCESNGNEIFKIYENIIELRKLLLESKDNDEKEVINNAIIKELKGKTQDLESYVRNLKNQFEESMKSLEDLNDGSSKDQTASIRDYIKNLTGSLKSINDKNDKLTLKVENMTSEILNKLKKDLACKHYA